MKRTSNLQFAIQIEKLERAALAKGDGHFTLYRFTTGWQAVIGTPDSREEIMAIPIFTTVGDAVEWAISQRDA